MTAHHHILRFTFFSLKIYFILAVCMSVGRYVSLSVSALLDPLELELKTVNHLLCLLEPSSARAVLSLTASHPPASSTHLPFRARERKQ